LRGKKPKLNPRQDARLVALYRAGEHTVYGLGDLFGVGRSTVYRAIQRDAARRAEPPGRAVESSVS
jgi:DNA-binding MarR family transcriptional regulator